MTDSITRTVEIAAPVDRVWQALTDHREFGTWFRVHLDGPFEVGQTTTGHMTWPGYEHLPWESTVTAMEAPHRFAYTWPHLDEGKTRVEDPDARTTVEFRLEETPEGTRLTITESGFDVLPAGRRDNAMRQNGEGWTIQAENIRTHVEG